MQSIHRPGTSVPLRAAVLLGSVMLGLAPRHFSAAATAPATAPAAAATAPAAAPVPIPDDLPKRPFRRLTEGPVTLNPGEGQDRFPYVDMYDSALAAPEVHHIRYMNEHVRFVEVAYFPGVRGRMHGHAYSSVFAIDAPVPRAVNLPLDPDRPNLMGRGAGPDGQDFPRCQTMGPQAPHAETNLDTWPHHFYRLEFLRVDGAGMAQHWREWYPRLAAAPTADSHHVLYEDAHVRLVEVGLRPGDTEAMHADPYPAVLAFDTAEPPAGLPVRYQAAGAARNQSPRTEGAPPPGLMLPTCATQGPQAAHAFTNNTGAPIHYYRVEFKRIDGDGLRLHWAEWYPWMADYKRAWDAKPYTLNY